MRENRDLNFTPDNQTPLNPVIRINTASSQNDPESKEENFINKLEVENNLEDKENNSSPSSSVIEDEINPSLKYQKTKTKNSNFTDSNTENYLKNNKNRKEENIYFYDKININFLRIFTIIIVIIYIILAITSMIIFQIRRDTDPYLFCFKFVNRDQEIKSDEYNYETILFLTDLNSFFIIHIILLFIFISILITLFKNDTTEVKKFFKDISIFFVLTLIFNIPIFFIGMFEYSFYEGGKWKSIVFLVLTTLGTLCMLKIYIKTKTHKYKKVSAIINQNILSGMLGGFEMYCLIYNICYVVSSNADEVKERYELEIISGVVYFVIGFLAISFKKDIFFPISMLILQIGLLYIKKKTSIATVLVNIGIVFLNFSSILLTIFKDNMNVYRLEKINKDENKN